MTTQWHKEVAEARGRSGHAIVGWREEPGNGAVPCHVNVVHLTSGVMSRVLVRIEADPATGRLPIDTALLRPVLASLTSADLDAVSEAIQAIDIDAAGEALATHALVKSGLVMPALGPVGRKAAAAFRDAVARTIVALRQGTDRPGTAMFTGSLHRIQKAAVSNVWADGAKGDGSAHVIVTGGEVIITPRDAVPEDGLDGAITTLDVRAVIARWGPALTDVQAAITREALLKMTFAGDVTLDLDALAKSVYPERQFGAHGKHLTAAEMREAVLSQVRALAAMTIRADEPVEILNRGGKRVKLEWEPSPMFWVVRCQRDENDSPYRVEVQASPSMRRRLQMGGRALPGIGTRRQFFPFRQAAGAWAYVMRDMIAEHVRWRTPNLLMVVAPDDDPRGAGPRALLTLTRDELLMTNPPHPHPQGPRHSRVMDHWDGAWDAIGKLLGQAVIVVRQDAPPSGRGWFDRWLEGRVTMRVDVTHTEFEGVVEVRAKRAAHVEEAQARKRPRRPAKTAPPA